MTTAGQQIAAQANANKNKDVFGSIIYNVKAYGAKGDGVTVDTNTIQSAITDAAVNGGVVAFPPGIFLTNSFTVPANVTLWFSNGAKLNINTGQIVTINGPLDAGIYQVFSGLGTVNGTIDVPAFYPQWWGAKGDGNDDTIPIQSAVTASQIVNGTVLIPKGNYSISAPINITDAITIIGSGTGVGPTGSGQVFRNNATNIEAKSSFSSGDMFSIVTTKTVIIENLLFSFNSTWAISPDNRRTSGAAISIQGSNPAVQYMMNNGTTIRNCAFVGQSNCIHQKHCVFNRIENCFFHLWGGAAVRASSLVAADETLCGWILNNFFYGDTVNTTTQNSCIHISNGYAWIDGNYMLGSLKGIIGEFTSFPVGHVSIKNNSLEQQLTYGIWLLNSNSTTVNMVEITGNQFAAQNYPALFSAHIYVQQGTTRWIEKVMIKDNVTNSTLDTSSAHFSIQDGKNISITGNILDNHGHANSQPIFIGASVTAPCLIKDNLFVNFVASPTYSAATIVSDMVKQYTIANMPTSAANGSEFYVSDGRPTSGTDSTLIGGGTGSVAYKINGVWKAID